MPDGSPTRSGRGTPGCAASGLASRSRRSSRRSCVPCCVPLHPAVLRLIRQVRRGAVREGIPVAVCGEMASDPLLLRLLVGCGLTEFSMTPGAITMARRVVRETSAGEMARIAARVMTLGTVEEIEGFLLESFGRLGDRKEVGTP